MRVDREVDDVRKSMLGGAVGAIVWIFVMATAEHLTLNSRLPPSFLAPGAPPGTVLPTPVTPPLVVHLWDLVSSVAPSAYGLVLLTAAFIWWGIPWLSRRSFDARVSTLSVESRLRVRGQRRNNRRVWIGMVAVYVVIGVVSGVCTYWSIPVFLGGLFLAMNGGAMIAMALFGRRMGHQRHALCSQCDYPMGSWRSAQPCCPECGLDWKAPWNASLGERRRDNRRLVWGAGWVVVSLVTSFVALW